MGTAATVTKLPMCNVCDQAGKRVEAHYDGKTFFGPWAYMCRECFPIYGVGLGTGKGQELIVKDVIVP